MSHIREFLNGARPLAELKDFIHDVVSQTAIAFELRFIKPLVAGRLVWKREVVLRVVHYVSRLIARERSLDVDENSIFRRLPIERLVADGSHRAMPGGRGNLLR